MVLEEFYKLRKDFTIIGLTGRTGAGCSNVAKLLSDNDFAKSITEGSDTKEYSAEMIKLEICSNYLKNDRNWTPFKTIKYKDVLLLHLCYEASRNNNSIQYIIDILCQNGDKDGYSNRFSISEDKEFLLQFQQFLEEWNDRIIDPLVLFQSINLTVCLKDDPIIGESNFADWFFNAFYEFAHNFYKKLNTYNTTKRTRLVHDIAINLREIGLCKQDGRCINLQEFSKIYTVAETINRIVKSWRRFQGGTSHIIIDSLKNSLELMYFKEKYSGFYMVAINTTDNEREEHIKKSVPDNAFEDVIQLDNTEYKGKEVNEGKLSSPDIENCIQKSDFHIFHSEEETDKDFYPALANQLIKLIALIKQPGIITPSANERIMQFAYSAKYNSGCISRQVGAVVVDINYSIKAIGWNDVAKGQVPCNLRNLKSFVEGNANDTYHSSYEKTGGVFKYGKNDDLKSFKKMVVESALKIDWESLEGRNCSFCFKAFQNAFEREKNQVHTRSLHAEENAMLQLTKYGGNGIDGGYLFTTASPCELCSKKAFQLGIKKIYYIDPYPGISKEHILSSGIEDTSNPKMIMFVGAVGRAYHKLYEPFMSYKDEVGILTKLKPKKSNLNIEDLVKDITDDEAKQKSLIGLLKKELDEN